MVMNEADQLLLLEWIGELEQLLRVARAGVWLARYDPADAAAREAVKATLAEFRARAAGGPGGQG